MPSEDSASDTDRLPLSPGRNNSGRSCTLNQTSDADLPDHITVCSCESHDGVCDVCGYKITVGSSGTEYGHARATNSAVRRDGKRQDCDHRPTSCNPGEDRSPDAYSRSEPTQYPITDGGMDVGDTEQVALSRNPEKREVAEVEQGERKPYCPDCGAYVGHSKSGGKPLPDREESCFGWECSHCNLTLPSNCHGPTAPMFNSSMAGLEVEFRNGDTRWVPVPSRYVDTATDRQEGTDAH